jgi:hypothetical protein
MNYFALLYVYVGLHPGMDVMTFETGSRFETLETCSKYMRLSTRGIFPIPEFEGYRQHGMLCFDLRSKDVDDAGE